MRFLTLNTHSWCEIHQIAKIRTLAKFIIEQQVDVIALQEVNQLTSTPVVKEPLNYRGGAGIPQFPRQINNVELRPIGIRIQPRLAAVLRITVVPDPAGLPLVSDPTIRQRPRCCIITKGVQADNGL